MKDRKKWEERVSKWEESGVSQAKFCKGEEISLSSFQYRKAIFDKEQSGGRFIELSSQEQNVIEFVLSEKLIVRVPLSTPVDKLSELAQCWS